MKTKITFPILLLCSAVSLLFAGDKAGKAGSFPYEKSKAEWKAQLSPLAYKVLREEGTERAWTSELNDEKRDGVYACAGCGQVLFTSKTKYESGSGWPSFSAPIQKDSVGYKTDRKFFMVRTEVHCSNCGGHLGHVFSDGPRPTGLRYCINGAALTFIPMDKDEIKQQDQKAATKGVEG